jgi:pyrroline-5-carboxylate reductase
MKTNVAILGGGNLGTAMAKGLAHKNCIDKYNTIVTRRNVGLIEYLEGKGINVTSDNAEAVENATLLILAIQPTQVETLINEIKPMLDSEKHILISAVTGVTDERIAKLIGRDFRIIRIMPNTAASINQSMTCIEKTAHSDAEKEVVELFQKLGETLLIETELMTASTVLGACGMAFFLRCIRAASQGGIEVGFHADNAQLIAAQTAVGAASLLQKTGSHPESEIDKVTTPMGCTIAGLNEMEHNGLSSALIKGIKTSYEKIADIG